ncbi:hypothetical protein JW756_04280 [Candidatus Woesearchaeota archaeon]|nr:hypothetical protein [Candidatus Woesearchaeota archaeon]
MRKAQAALEFMTTYGWAFLVVLVMIGALAYFGVLNPNKILPSKCIVEAGFNCRDYVIHTGDFSIYLVNSKGGSLKNVDIISITSDQNRTGIPVDTCTINSDANPVSVAADENMIITCTNAGMFTGMTGNKVKIKFLINYTMAMGMYPQRFEGNLYTDVQ